MMRNYCWRALIATLVFSVCWLGQAQTLGPIPITHAQDVIKQWQPSRHLYFKGKLGVSEQQFAALAQWQDAHAPNWTVVLLENADNENYTDAQGVRYSGVE